ncbi:MAG: glycosyltransferase [Candidatus Promineifilaceae bacterium]
MTELALKHGVNLSFRVDVSESELVELYNRARAFVYAPILEPFGLTPVEAMACGLPVVAVREGGVRESVVNEQTGFLVDRDPVKFALKLTQLLQDDYLGNQLGKNGRKHVMDCWTWPHAYERFVDAVATVTPEQDRKENRRGNQNCT